MMKPIDIYNYERQGNLAIDMVAACILHERRFNMPIKAIILDAAYYEMLKSWVRDNYGEEYAEAEFALDTVTIRKEKIYSGKPLLIEYEKMAEA